VIDFMGMYDTILIENYICPYCSDNSDKGFQTKDGPCSLDDYEIGDLFDYERKLKYITAIGSCSSLVCQIEAAKEHVWCFGYYGGFSRSFDVTIELDDEGKITNNVRLTELSNHKGIMEGIVGEFKEDNFKYHYKNVYKNNKFISSNKVEITKNGWLDKFKDAMLEEPCNKTIEYFSPMEEYAAILYLFNIEDGVRAFEYWFFLRHKFANIINALKDMGLEEDVEYASVFLSNDIDVLMELN
jgi:hypothetical protein